MYVLILLWFWPSGSCWQGMENIFFLFFYLLESFSLNDCSELNFMFCASAGNKSWALWGSSCDCIYRANQHRQFTRMCVLFGSKLATSSVTTTNYRWSASLRLGVSFSSLIRGRGCMQNFLSRSDSQLKLVTRPHFWKVWLGYIFCAESLLNLWLC